MDFSRLRTGEKIVGAGGLLLLISLWLSWYGVEIPELPGGFEIPGGIDTTATAWQAFDLIDLLLFLVALIAIAHVVLTATGNSPALPVAGSVIATGAGALATLLIVFRILSKPDAGGADLNLKFGIFIGLLSAAAIAYGGWRAMQEEESPGMVPPVIEDRPAPPAAPPPVTDPAPTPAQDAGAVPEGAPPAAEEPPADRPA